MACGRYGRACVFRISIAARTADPFSGSLAMSEDLPQRVTPGQGKPLFESRRLLAGLCALAIGFGAGMLVGSWHGTGAPAPVAAADPSIPTPRGPGSSNRVDDAPACELRLAACVSAIDRLSAQSTGPGEDPGELRPPSAILSSVGGEPSALETTEAWSAVIEQAMQACDSSIQLDNTDCSDWPCVGLTRAIGIDDETKACLSDAVEQGGLSQVGLLEFDVKCRHGGFDTVTVIMANDEHSEASAAFEESEDLGAVIRSYMAIGGRVDAALRSWDCAEGGPE